MARVLVVDDEKNIRTHLTTFLRDLEHQVATAADAAGALQLLNAESFDVVLSDVRMPDSDGLALLQQLHARHPEVTVILMTAYATVPQAVEAIRAGAYDYLVKPFSLEQVRVAVDRALEVRALRRENAALRNVIGESPVMLRSRNALMQRALATAEQAAASDATILLTGESGTGKNVLAAAIHRWSQRRNGPFVTVTCTTLSENLIESELFGHAKGAFTGAWKDKPGRLEAAQGGTVFLDEIGELPLESQAKLLRVIEEHAFERVGGNETLNVDVRLIAATNRDLAAEVKARRFRQDLFFRVNVVEIRLPPLRERSEDLPQLIEHLLGALCARYRRRLLKLADDALRALLAYSWPGNVRELHNALERAVALARGEVISAEDLPDNLVAPCPSAMAKLPQPKSLEEIERHHIEQVLAESATLEEAAARLGINPTTLWRKRKRYGID